MTSSASSLGFLDLPAELRNRIYKISLHIRPRSIKLYTYYSRTCPRFRLYRRRGLRRTDSSGKRILTLAPNILATCKQIRAEALPVLYGNTVIRTDSALVSSFSEVLNRMELTLSSIRHLHLLDDVSTGENESDFAFLADRYWTDLPDLQSLHVDVTIHSPEPPSKCGENIADRIFPLVKRMQENRSKIGEPSSLLNMLEMTLSFPKSPLIANRGIKLKIQASLEEKSKA